MFTHLHLHSEYSLLDGFARIKPLIKKVKDMGMSSVAITDHGVMFGVVDFYKEAVKHGIKPIIGCEVYTSARAYTQKDSTFDKNSGHLVLLAKNNQGYQNLIKLVSEGFVHGFYYKPRIDYKLLEEYSEGIIALSACLAGDVQQALLYDDYKKAREVALNLKRIFGKENFYLELQDHQMPEQKKVNMQLLKLSKDVDIDLVATNDVHYLERQDAAIHDILLCIQTGKNISDSKRMKFPTDQFYLKSPEEMKALFSYAPEAISNTQKIADMCDVKFDFDSRHLPEYQLPDSYNHDDYLRELCLKGLKERYPDYTKHLERLDYELNTISEMGFSDYFLIVWDFIKYAKDNGIAVGPGRGSVGGSIVAYVLRITDVDPIKYDLIFERFLNPERVTMPDIDIDFEDSRRQEVIDYVIEKYGKDHVSQIITFGTMAAKAALRDVARVVELPYIEADKLAKAVPFALGMTLDKALDQSKEFKQMYDENETLRQVIKAAKGVEGMPRHASTHAAGVVISKLPVDQYVPLYLQDESITTQFSMTLLEELGLLKMDFLGLRTLKVIKDTLGFLEDRGIQFEFNESYDDQATFELIGNGDCLGIFQLESSGMIRFMKELKPTSLEDIIAGISLYRPGPMDSIPKYLLNKNNPQLIKYDHPMLESILDVTYGCIVYQEQVMRIVRELGGFSYGRSDIVRRAMSKKKKDVMNREKEIFIHGVTDEAGNVVVDGCVRRGVPVEVAESIFSDMDDFAKYAFNKSHAAGYGIIAYQTAYLKAHYPVEFMAATMSSMIGNHSKIARYINDCNKMKIEILPPNINHSTAYFSVEDGKIRYGLKSVKNVGSGIIDSIETERPFKSFIDFCEKIDHKELNKRAVESLIKAGAFDCFDHNRAQLLASFDKIVDSIHNEKRRNAKGQLSLFGLEGVSDSIGAGMLDRMADIEELKDKVKLNFEKDVLGLYLSGHPLEEIKEMVEKVSSMNLADLKEAATDESFQKSKDGQVFNLAGMLIHKRNMTTKAGKIMSFIQVEDLFDAIEIIVFPKVYDRCQHLLKEDQFVIVVGRLNFKEDEEPKLIADNIMVLNEENSRMLLSTKTAINKLKKPAKKEPKLFLKLETKNESLIGEILKELKVSPGKMPVILYFADSKNKMIAPKHLWVNSNESLIKSLKNILGENSVIIQ